ncbi:MAG: hypothetical protein P8016_04995 [Sedimentisphaerales bacterium]
MKAKDENLRELIEKFMDAKNARTYLEDIEAGERILRECPAPRPDDMVLANIKANMSLHKLHQRTVTFRKRVFEALAIAASIAIIAIISFSSILETPRNPGGGPPERSSVVPAGWWVHQDTGYVDVISNFENISTQLDQMAAEDYDEDAFYLDEFQNQIEQVKDHLENMDTETYTAREYSNPGSILEEIENQLNELSGSFWQDDYSNAGVYE